MNEFIKYKKIIVTNGYSTNRENTFKINTLIALKTPDLIVLVLYVVCVSTKNKSVNIYINNIFLINNIFFGKLLNYLIN